MYYLDKMTTINKSTNILYKNIYIPHIHEWIAGCIMLWILNPMSYGFYNPLFLVGMVCIWFFIAFVAEEKILIKSIKNKAFLVAWGYPLVLLLYAIIGHCQFEKNSVIVPFIMLIFLYYVSREDKRPLR